MYGLIVKVSTFDDISTHFPLDFKYSADHSLLWPSKLYLDGSLEPSQLLATGKSVWLASLRLRTIAGDGAPYPGSGLHNTQLHGYGPRWPGDNTQSWTIPTRIPRQIGAGLCPADSVPLVGTPWWVGSKLGERYLQSCMPLPIVLSIEGIRTSEAARTPALLMTKSLIFSRLYYSVPSVCLSSVCDVMYCG